MSDKDVVQREDQKQADPASHVVDLGHRAPKQDLWDIDDDIFKPLLDRIEAERKEEEAKQNTIQSDYLNHSANNFQGSPQMNPMPMQMPSHGGTHSISPDLAYDLGLITKKDHHDDLTPLPLSGQSKERRKPVVEAPQPAVTIRSQSPSMPRIVWSQSSGPIKKIKSFVSDMNRRAQLVLSGLGIFAAWNIVILMVMRMVSLSAFHFDPIFKSNWEMLYRLYQQGSTFQWNFVLFFVVMGVILPLFGILLSIRGAGELRPIVQKTIDGVLYIPRQIYRRMTGRHVSNAPFKLPTYTGPLKKGYHGATFKMDKKNADETSGGSVGGGAGGGHGKPSWQGGPANTQAFPRDLQPSRR